ncbi:LCP family protein [Patescibacteria group bacterium]|nr:LCP family protein [Patescibacteria group bacterium]
MDEEKSVDFLKRKYQLVPDRHRQKIGKTALRAVVIVFIFLAISGTALSFKIKVPNNNVADNNLSLFSSFKNLVTSGEKDLVGEEDDRINFLLLGIGGEGHDGPELTDTIMFGSFQPSTSEVGLLSIPRDLIVPIPDYGYRKINHVNAYAEMDSPGSGLEESADVIGEILDQKIHYTVKVDFNGFEELIDAIGGVDVYVDRSFADYTYPTDDHLIQTIEFTEGWTHMDGDTSLKFARSRHGTNGEGSDFSRAERQQKILLAVKDKILSPSVLLNPGKLNKIIQTFQDNVETNLTFWEMTKMARLAPDVSTENIHLTVLDASPDSPLYQTNINGAYVLLPKRDDWSQVREIATNIYSAQTTEESGLKKIAGTPVKIEIQNGTSVSGLAFQTSQMLISAGFDVRQIGNADSKGYEQTIIYDLTEGQKSEELAILKDFLEADVSMSATGWIFADEVVPRELTISTPGEEHITTSEPIDFLVILGQTAENLVYR